MPPSPWPSPQAGVFQPVNARSMRARPREFRSRRLQRGRVTGDPTHCVGSTVGAGPGVGSSGDRWRSTRPLPSALCGERADAGAGRQRVAVRDTRASAGHLEWRWPALRFGAPCACVPRALGLRSRSLDTLAPSAPSLRDSLPARLSTLSMLWHKCGGCEEVLSNRCGHRSAAQEDPAFEVPFETEPGEIRAADERR